MRSRKGDDIAGVTVELGPVRQKDVVDARNVVLEVRRHAPVGARLRLHVLGPPPPGLEREATDLGPADVDDLDLSLLEGTDLIGLVEGRLLSP
jgi:hypothetical protein